MMGIFGEQIQHAFVLSLFFHQIVQDQQTPSRGAKPFGQMNIVEHGQRAVVPLSPITGQQHGNLVFFVGTHGSEKPILAQ